MYGLLRLSERLQILVTMEQRDRLVAEVARRETSVGGLIREAIDSHLPTFSGEERLRAFEAIAGAEGGRYLAPHVLHRIIEGDPANPMDRIRRPERPR